MGQVQNGRLYIRYRSSFMKNKANQSKMLINYILWTALILLYHFGRLFYGVKGAKGHVIDAASIILPRKGWSLAKLTSCVFLPLHDLFVGGPTVTNNGTMQTKIHIANITTRCTLFNSRSSSSSSLQIGR